MNDLEKQFYSEINESINYYLKHFENILKNQLDPILIKEYKESFNKLSKHNFSNEEMEALKNIIKKIIQGVISTLFVSIDGGTALSHNGKALALINLKENKELTEGALHENFTSSIVEKTPIEEDEFMSEFITSFKNDKNSNN